MAFQSGSKSASGYHGPFLLESPSECLTVCVNSCTSRSIIASIRASRPAALGHRFANAHPPEFLGWLRHWDGIVAAAPELRPLHFVAAFYSIVPLTGNMLAVTDNQGDWGHAPHDILAISIAGS